MSEEDPRYSDAEVEDEEEADVKSVASSVAGSQILQSRLKRTGSNRSTVDPSSLTEAEKAMIAVKKRHEDEEAAKLQDYEEKRRIEREKEEEELRLLKEKQEQRRVQREEEEREMNERRRIEEERRKIEEDERKARMDAERLKKEEARRLKGLGVGSPFAMTPPIGSGGRNFVLPDKKDKGGEKSDRFGNIVQAKQEMGMTKDQQEAAKTSYLAGVMRSLQLTNLFGVDLKSKLKEMHQRICKLETEKYDLEKRHERQEYDLKELNERQRQVTRNRNKKKGLDSADSTRYPPKVAIISKYDRQIDRRTFRERKSVYDKQNAYPCFPNVPPPPALMERTVYRQSEGALNGRMEHDEDEDGE